MVNQICKITLHRIARLEEERPSISLLFSMGCGFTEFLSRLFFHLPLPQVGQAHLVQGQPAQVLACRLVSPTWRDFIDLEAGRGWSPCAGGGPPPRHPGGGEVEGGAGGAQPHLLRGGGGHHRLRPDQGLCGPQTRRGEGEGITNRDNLLCLIITWSISST